ncbi:MAG: 30S ribosomal protein S5 [Promethearchaeota archaeon]
MQRRKKKRDKPLFQIEDWKPRTRVGRLVRDEAITSMEALFSQNYTVEEKEIVDVLMNNVIEKVVDVSRVQRQTDAGRKTVFRATAIVGNGDGYIGVGDGKAQGVGVAIRQAIEKSKTNIIPVKRGCGSWECLCKSSHSVPFLVEGKTASCQVILMPAPRGLGLVIGDTGKLVLRLAGISDVWSKTHGETRTVANFCLATFKALKQTYGIPRPQEWG